MILVTSILQSQYIYGNFGAGRNEWAQEKGTACFRQRFRPRYRDGGTSPRGDGTDCLLCTPQVRSAGANDMHPGGSSIARGEWTPRRRPAGEPVARQTGPSPRGDASARAHTVYRYITIRSRAQAAVHNGGRGRQTGARTQSQNACAPSICRKRDHEEAVHGLPRARRVGRPPAPGRGGERPRFVPAAARRQARLWLHRDARRQRTTHCPCGQSAGSSPARRSRPPGAVEARRPGPAPRAQPQARRRLGGCRAGGGGAHHGSHGSCEWKNSQKRTTWLWVGRCDEDRQSGGGGFRRASGGDALPERSPECPRKRRAAAHQGRPCKSLRP